MTLLVATISTATTLILLDVTTCCTNFSHTFIDRDIVDINGGNVVFHPLIIKICLAVRDNQILITCYVCYMYCSRNATTELELLETYMLLVNGENGINEVHRLVCSTHNGNQNR